MRHLRHAAWKHNIKIYKTDAHVNVPRLNDFARMDMTVQAKIFTRDELQSINRCRLYMQIFFLSDIVFGNGRVVLQEILDEQMISQRKSQWKWPRQTRPPPRDWNLFHIALHEVWIHSETQQLERPLGTWLHKSHQIYEFVYHSDTDSIYETFTNGSIRHYTRSPGVTRLSSKYRFDTTVTSLPSTFLPVNVITIDDDNIIGEPYMSEVGTKQESPISSWTEFVHSQHQNVKYLLRHAHIHNDGRDIATAIRNKTAVAVSDASVEQTTRTAAISWVISDKYESFRDFGDAGCPKFHRALDSYGSESFGLLVLLTTVKLICEYYRIKTSKIVIACDKCVRTEYRAKTSDKYFDLLWATYDLRKALKIKIQYKHITGHQDGKKRKLTLLERLNVECDRRSKIFRYQLKQGLILHQPIHFGTNHWSVTLYDLRMSYSLMQSMNDHILGTKLINKMITKGELSCFFVRAIDWDAIAGASKMQTSGERLWLTKFVSGFAPTAI